jgi:hypothetical protein
MPAIQHFAHSAAALTPLAPSLRLAKHAVHHAVFRLVGCISAAAERRVYFFRLSRQRWTDGNWGQVRSTRCRLVSVNCVSRCGGRDASIRYCGNIAGLALVTLVNVRVLLLHYSINAYAVAAAVCR